MGGRVLPAVVAGLEGEDHHFVGPAAAAAAPVETPKAPPFKAVVRTLAPKPSFWLLAFGAASSSVCGYGVAAWLPSAIEGGDGNREFFIHARRAAA